MDHLRRFRCPSPACRWVGPAWQLDVTGAVGQRIGAEGRRLGELGFCPECKHCIRTLDEWVSGPDEKPEGCGGSIDCAWGCNGCPRTAPPPPSPPNILREADQLTGDGGERNDSYDHPYPNFSKIAAMWRVLLRDRLVEGAEITPQDVARMMIAMKLVRDNHKSKRDNWVDIAGYARCLERLQEHLK